MFHCYLHRWSSHYKLCPECKSSMPLSSKEKTPIEVAMEALNKIRDPRNRHSEPDKYTELACVMNIADEAYTKIEEMQRLSNGK